MNYSEINDLLSVDNASGLRERVAVATLVAADAIRLEVDDPTSATVQARKRFAQQLFKISFSSQLIFRRDNTALALQPQFESIYRAVVIGNKDATPAQIASVTDAQIQAKVNDAVDYLARNFPDPVTP